MQEITLVSKKYSPWCISENYKTSIKNIFPTFCHSPQWSVKPRFTALFLLSLFCKWLNAREMSKMLPAVFMLICHSLKLNWDTESISEPVQILSLDYLQPVDAYSGAHHKISLKWKICPQLLWASPAPLALSYIFNCFPFTANPNTASFQ